MKTSAEEYLKEFKKLQDGTIKRMTQIPSDEPRFIIDSNTRKITIPDDFTFLGVKNDSYAETIYFEIDRYFDAEDLTKHTIVVQYCDNSTPPPSEGDYPIGIDVVTDIDIDTVPGKIIFGWTIKNEATFRSTEIAFSIRFYSIDEQTSRFSYSLNTLTSELPILDTLNVSQAAAQRYANILDEWLRRMQGIQNYIDSLDLEVLEGKAAEAAKSAKAAAKSAEQARDTLTYLQGIGLSVVGGALCVTYDDGN